MLVIPSDSRYTGGRRAVMTWLLVLLNCAIFFYGAGRAHEREKDALDYYERSNLAAYEFPAYLVHLKLGGDESKELYEHFVELRADELPAQAVRRMGADMAFQMKLDEGKLIPPAQEGYADWSREHQAYRRKLDDALGLDHALNPAKPTALSLLSYQFLHGGFDHLLGNMVVLILIGQITECALGAWRFLGAYLLTGIAAGGAFLLLRLGGNEPLVGASGAIAGVMGLFATTFGARRVRFFYTVLFYFGFAVLPALLVLPYWLLWELVQYLMAGGTHVAYEAHMGGLIAGAACGLLLRKLPDAEQTQTQLDRPDQERAYEAALAEATQLMGRMQLDRAQQQFERLHLQRPADTRPLEKLYAIARMAPNSPEYHQIAGRILAAAPASVSIKQLISQVRDEYMRVAQPGIALPPELLTPLFEHYAHRGQAAEADRLLKALLAAKVRDPRIRPALMFLAGRMPEDKQRAYNALAARHFP